MEQKKQLIIQVLTKLKPYRNLAEGFLALIKGSDDKDFIDKLLIFIHQQIHQIQDKQKKELVLQEIQNIKRIQDKEQKYGKEDTEEAEQLLDFLTNKEI